MSRREQGHQRSALPAAEIKYWLLAGFLINGRANGMQVVLKVVGGKNDGREISISVPKFIIGRGEEPPPFVRPATW